MIAAEPPVNLINFIKEGDKFLVAGHKDPDGDCVSSQLALCSALRRLGKQAAAVSAGPFNYKEVAAYEREFLVNISLEDRAGARLIICDCAAFDRTGSIAEQIAGLPFAVIDHHHRVGQADITAVKNYAASYIDVDAPSTTVLVQTLIKSLGLAITPLEAELLFFGLCTDTGFFRHVPACRPSAFLAAGELCGLGANPKHMYARINGGKSFASRLLTGRILAGARAFFDGRLLLIRETFDDFEEFGRESRDSDTLYQLLQAVEGVEAVAFIKQESLEKCVVGLRSTDKVDVAAIAAALGGGGHKNASGATVEADAADVEWQLLDLFDAVFNAQ
jgi:phosphoesterase RecJ-like protein